MKDKVALVLFLISSQNLLAAGSGGVGDLKWSAVNFLILSCLIVWKVKKPLKDYFDKNEKEVASLAILAEKKDKEAKIKLEMYRNKMNGLSGEREKIMSSLEVDKRKYKETVGKEMKDHKNYLVNDFKRRIDQERRMLIHQMSFSLIDEIMVKAKEKIRRDSNLRNQVTEKLISQIS